MGMDYGYVSIDRIFSKYIREKDSDFDEGDLVEFIGEALEFIGASNYYEEQIHFADVKNHQCELPKWLHSVIQVARNTKTNSLFESSICPKDVAKSIAPEVFTLFTTSQHGLSLNDQEIPYYKSFFNLKCGFNTWCGSGFYTGCYVPVRLSTNTMFNNIICNTDNNSSCNNYGNDTYTIIRKKTIRFSFKEGSVAIPYLRQVVDDETGYPLIPDNISYTTAITWYIKLKMAEKDFENGRAGAEGRLKYAGEQWNWYCGQASNVDKMPSGIDQHQNLLDQRSYMLPRNNRYYGFFGNLNKPESRTWNDPDRRNSHGAYFKGN